MHHEHDHVDYDGDENGDDNVDDDVDDDGDEHSDTYDLLVRVFSQLMISLQFEGDRASLLHWHPRTVSDHHQGVL